MITHAGALGAIASRDPASNDRRAVSIAGWLFDAREFEPTPEPTPADLDAIVTGLTSAAAMCSALGLVYLPVLVPAKRNAVKAAPTSDRGWVGELNARIRDVDEVDLFNLLTVLRHAARHGPCYHRTDAEWNGLGAFFVARALLKEAHKSIPALRPAPPEDLHMRPVHSYRGTLIGAPRLEWLNGELVGSEHDLEPEEGAEIDASRLHARRMPVEPALGEAGPVPVRVYANAARDRDARLAVVGGPAALPVAVWLAERTSRTALFSSPALPPAELEIERPPLVIHLIGETDLLMSRGSGAEGWAFASARQDA
ncbi:MAG TPA: hypothetical protein VKG38_00815 [Solirubrobacteraceae bacterium]|nr:hypothetical protein [Solirubrobacteraceae bacterium]